MAAEMVPAPASSVAHPSVQKSKTIQRITLSSIPALNVLYMACQTAREALKNCKPKGRLEIPRRFSPRAI
jgi:hypothetical protein